LSDQKAVEMCETGKNVYCECSDQAVREKIALILKRKHEKAHHGDLYEAFLTADNADFCFRISRDG
jgi:hypothetical protein